MQVDARLRSTKAGIVVPATHGRRQAAGSDRVHRSTKAGIVVPATLPLPNEVFHAVRRSTKAGIVVPATRGLEAGGIPRARQRSTKAGIVVPATRGVERDGLIVDRARSTKAGIVVPATLADAPVVDVFAQRSTKAGIVVPATPDTDGRIASRIMRSTKAGIVVPATRGRNCARCWRCRSLNEGRDCSPGDTRLIRLIRKSHCPALNEGRTPPEGRSTKAGIVVPATRPPPESSVHAATAPLNEGRDCSPGDTWMMASPLRYQLDSLNEGRDCSPGDTPPCRRFLWPRGGTLNEGRDCSPGDTRIQSTVRCTGRARSTKAGIVVPATPEIGMAVNKYKSIAQRRPGL